jgi:negative regulator of flagellin synthesis FlgM
MKITPSTDINVPASQTGNAGAQKASQEPVATAKSSASSAGVSVSVSNLARALEKPETSSPGDVDLAKVASVKAALQDGSFVVSPEAIADKLLSNAQELLNRTTN